MDYDWQQDAFECWRLAIRWKAITGGYVRPRSLVEMYWAESHGAIP